MARDEMAKRRQRRQAGVAATVAPLQCRQAAARRHRGRFEAARAGAMLTSAESCPRSASTSATRLLPPTTSTTAIARLLASGALDDARVAAAAYARTAAERQGRGRLRVAARADRMRHRARTSPRERSTEVFGELDERDAASTRRSRSALRGTPSASRTSAESAPALSVSHAARASPRRRRRRLCGSALAARRAGDERSTSPGQH